MAENAAIDDSAAQRRAPQWAVWAGWLGVLGVIALFVAGLLVPRSIVYPEIPDAKDFEMPLFDRGTVQLSDYRGQVVVLNFWASWCIPCRDEAPVIEKLHREYRGRDVVFLGVNMQDAENDARAFIDEFRLSYVNGRDLNGSIYIMYGVAGVPETFIIGGDGEILRKHVGPINERLLRNYLEEALQ